MPLKETPWGSMNQARSAQHTPGNVPRPPKPAFLPPAPPKCSASPLPPAVEAIGKAEAISVVYDRVISPVANGHDSNNIAETEPVLTPNLTNIAINIVSSEFSNGINESPKDDEEKTSEYLPAKVSEDISNAVVAEEASEEDEVSEDEEDNEYYYEEELELKLETEKKSPEFVEEVHFTLPVSIEEVKTDDSSSEEEESSEEESDEDDDSSSASSNHEQQPSINIVEITDLKECEGLQTVDECTVNEVDDDDHDDDDGASDVVIEDLDKDATHKAEVKDPTSAAEICVDKQIEIILETTKMPEIEQPKEVNNVLDHDEARKEMLKKMPTPKVPAFVKSEPPCDFKEDPNTWIEWLEGEVLQYKEKQLEKKKKEIDAAQEAEALAAAKEAVAEAEAEAEAEAAVKEAELELGISFLLANPESEEEKEPLEEGEEEEKEAVEEATTGAPKEEADEEEWEWEGEEDIENHQPAIDATKESEDKESSTEGIKEPVQSVVEEVEEEQVASVDTTDNELKEQTKETQEEKEEEKDNFTTTEKIAPQHQRKRIVPSKESDPMEVVERMRQMRQNRVLQKQISADGSEVSAAPPFMRAHSNPDGRLRSRPSSLATEDNLDDMLGRVRKLREERKQILKDMAMLKDAFDVPEEPKYLNSNDDGVLTDSQTATDVSTPNSFEDGGVGTSSSAVRSRLLSFDSGIGQPSKSVTTEGSIQATRKISHQSSENNQNSDVIYCFICDEELGSKLNKGAVMHMGLDDGEPICPEALNLTEKSKERIKNIALTHLDLREKYEFLETLDLDLLAGEDYELTSEDVLQKVEHFLDNIEEEKKKDQEQFDLLRAGAIDEIFAAEFAADLESKSSLLTTSYTSEGSAFDYLEDTDLEESVAVEEEEEEDEESQLAFESVDVIQQHPAPPPPPPPPPTAAPSTTVPNNLPQSHLKEARSDLLNAIKTKLKTAPTAEDQSESSTEAVGKVLHKHLAPTVFTKEIRDLMHDIQKPDKKLKKTKTHDRSKPYIPKDIEIYFYAGPNADKKLAPPPASREIPSKLKSPSPPPTRTPPPTKSWKG
jgi:hypothetical protein